MKVPFNEALGPFSIPRPYSQLNVILFPIHLISLRKLIFHLPAFVLPGKLRIIRHLPFKRKRIKEICPGLDDCPANLATLFIWIEWIRAQLSSTFSIEIEYLSLQTIFIIFNAQMMWSISYFAIEKKKQKRKQTK